MQGVPRKQATAFQNKISALIHATYCSSLKFIIALERRMRENTQFKVIHKGDEERLLIIKNCLN